ncbi:pro-resilin [Diachasma alloeum]|uniref:pro-resilin n=1 Tax=Diachasma alloeum TaxID=454923 RepID=UPI000738460A|nr:pro-resilin [Diachasma alloeum]
MVSATKNRYHETPDQRESYKHHGKDTKYDRYAGKYAFEYHVADVYSANDFGHQETRNEYLTKGNYHVRLPDGRLQKVSYHVDEGGYHANVSYEPNNQYYYV